MTLIIRIIAILEHISQARKIFQNFNLPKIWNFDSDSYSNKSFKAAYKYEALSDN